MLYAHGGRRGTRRVGYLSGAGVVVRVLGVVVLSVVSVVVLSVVVAMRAMRLTGRATDGLDARSASF